MLKKLIKLFVASLCLWLLFVYVLPALVNQFPSWQRYNRIQEEQGLDSGALYYSNVPQTQEAEEAMRRAVREGMAERRKARMAKQ